MSRASLAWFYFGHKLTVYQPISYVESSKKSLRSMSPLTTKSALDNGMPVAYEEITFSYPLIVTL